MPIILAIDPGYERLGVAVLTKNEQGKELLLHSACLRTPSKDPFPTRLHKLGTELEAIIATHNPSVLAIEKLYFQNNQKTAMYVSQTIGMILYIAQVNNMEIYEYTPLQIKSAITGNGRADKAQMMHMIPLLVHINKEIKYDDEYDAIACGLTHLAYNPKL